MTEAPQLDKESLLEAIAAAQASYISSANTREVFDGLLVQLLELTGSEYGYIGEVLYEDGKPYLRTHAISNIAWNDETRAFYEAHAPTGLEFRNLASLFGHVIDKNEVVIANDPASDPRAGGLPPGHPPLRAYLGLPFVADGKLVGSAGISNRAGGYDDEVVDYLKPFTATCANLLLANRAQRDHERTERLKSEFVAIVSHELRTPMTSILGSMRLLEGMHGDTLDPKAAKLVAMANDGCRRMIRLLDDLLDVEKLESNTISLQLGEHAVKAIIDRSLEELAPAAATKKIRLTSRGAEDVKLVADADRLSQIVINLVSNAIKFTPPGGAVDVACRDAGDVIELCVADDGDGIPADELDSIFDKFHQAGEANTRAEGGVGLGLYIVKSLVEQHRGTVVVESVPGEGTRFYARFPKGWTTTR